MALVRRCADRHAAGQGACGCTHVLQRADKGNEAFWQHEWECHGICAGVEDSALTSESGFFGTVLQLDSQYPLNVRISPQQLTDLAGLLARKMPELFHTQHT